MFDKAKAKIKDAGKSIKLYSEQISQEMITESVMKMIKPMIPKATESFNEFLGDDEKVIIIRKPKNSDTPLFFVVNRSGLEIAIDPKAIEHNFSLAEGLEKAFSGGLFEKKENETDETKLLNP